MHTFYVIGAPKVIGAPVDVNSLMAIEKVIKI